MRSAALLTVVFLALPAAQAEEPSCGANEPITECFDRMKKEAEVKEERRGQGQGQAMVMEKVQTEKLNSDSSTCTASALKDALSSFFGVLGLGTVEGCENGIVINLNSTTLWGPDSPIGMRGTLHTPKVFEPLLNAFPEADRASRRETFENPLQVGDDAEIEVSFSSSKRNEAVLGEAVSLLTGEIFRSSRPKGTADSQAWNDYMRKLDGNPNLNLDLEVDSLKTLCQEVGTLKAADISKQLEGKSQEEKRNYLKKMFPDLNLGHFADSDPVDMEGLAKDLAAAETEHVQKLLTKAALAAAARHKTFIDEFFANQISKLADLANNEPQWSVTANYRNRDIRVGPDEGTVKVVYERGRVNLSSLRRNCKDITADCYSTYVSNEDTAVRLAAASRIALSAEYTEARRYHFALPAEGFQFSIAPTRKVAAAFTYGRNLRTAVASSAGSTSPPAGAQLARMDFELKYNHTSGDDKRSDNMLTATLTFTGRLTGAANSYFSVVYANKPEYLGQVDRHVSTRVGLRFKTDKRD